MAEQSHEPAGRRFASSTGYGWRYTSWGEAWMTLRRETLVLVVAVGVVMCPVRVLGAGDCPSMLALSVNGVYEFLGRAVVAVQLTNISDQRIMLSQSTGNDGRQDVWYRTRVTDDRLASRTPDDFSSDRTFSTPLGSRQSCVVEIWDQPANHTFQATFAFLPVGTTDTCLASVDVPKFSMDGLPTAISRLEAVRTATLAGFPSDSDSTMQVNLTWSRSLGRVWELSARVSNGDSTRGPVDTTAFVGAFSGRFLGFGSVHRGRVIRG